MGEKQQNPRTTEVSMAKRRYGFWALGLIVLVVAIDQFVKLYVKTHFALYEQVEVFSWFKLYFVENDGMAFGLDFLGTAPLACFRVIAISAFCFYLRRLVQERTPWGMIACISLIIAGAVGNLLDNAFYGEIFTESVPQGFGEMAHLVDFGTGYGEFLSGKVVDMFYFPLFTWPTWMPLVGGEVFFGAVFNFADAAINVGAIALILFYYKRLFQTPAQTKEKDVANV